MLLQARRGGVGEKRNWEAQEESQSAESSDSRYRSYASTRSFFEPEVGIDIEVEALQVKFLFKTLI
jgi:hypothetical protein